MKVKELATVTTDYEEFRIVLLNPKDQTLETELGEVTHDDMTNRFGEFEVERLQLGIGIFREPFIEIYVVGEEE